MAKDVMPGVKQLNVHVRGMVGLIVHNGQLSDSLNEHAIALSKAVKAASGKSKTVANTLETAHVEFLGGLYIGEDGAPCIPGEVLESSIRTAARKTKKGKEVEAGLWCEGEFPLIYDGPRVPEELWNAGANPDNKNPIQGRRFVDRRRVRVGQSAVQRTRPIFQKWELKFVVSFDPTLLDREDIVGFLDLLGRIVGLCEIRPRYGRFEVVSVEDGDK